MSSCAQLSAVICPSHRVRLSCAYAGDFRLVALRKKGVIVTVATLQ